MKLNANAWSVALCALVAGSVMAAATMQINIVVSPHTLVRKSNTSACLTVHADLDYLAVAEDSVVLYVNDQPSGIEPNAVFADDRGDLVAKFDLQQIKPAVKPPNAKFVLAGQLRDGTPFSGADVVRVR